jgi:hypothetical protein
MGEARDFRFLRRNAKTLFPKGSSAAGAPHKIRFALLFAFSDFFPPYESLALLVKPQTRSFVLNGKFFLQSSSTNFPLHDYISTICQSPEARLISQKRAPVTEKRIENDSSWKISII